MFMSTIMIKKSIKMKKILANDGLSKTGITHLEKNGFTVINEKVAQENLEKFINDQKGMILYLSLKLLLPNHIQKLEDTKFPSKEIH